MKTIIKAFFLFVALSASIPVFAQSDFEALMARAEAGEAKAQFDLAEMYAKGDGVEPSNQEAVKWYRFAADQGYALAQYNLGFMYERGRGVDYNDQEAVKWYRLAAEQGLADAQFNLGSIYADGRGVEQNYQDAVKWYRLAAEKGHAGAQSALRSFKTRTKSHEYFIDGLVVIHSERQFTNCAKGSHYTIDITGDIGPDSSFALEELLKRSPSCVNQDGVTVSRTIVNLSSNGGLVEDG